MIPLIYVDSDTCNWHLDQLDCQLNKTKDIDVFVNSTAEVKLAIFHIPFPLNGSFCQRVDQILNHADKIVILCSELHSDTVGFIQGQTNNKIKYFSCGMIDNVEQELWLDWFITTGYFYKTNNVLDQLVPYAEKPKTFDILLGQPKPHRTFVYNYINNSKLNDRVIMTYMTNFNNSIQTQDSNGWQWGIDGLELPNYEFNWTVTPVKYHGYEMSLSQVVPIDIYNQTAYSVIAETNFENHYTFFTEKTVKPILARRLFVTIAGQHYLRTLRQLGFKTFDTVIDESYDSIADSTVRWSIACRQINYLINTPQLEILEKIKPIVEHNRQLMLNRDWLAEYQQRLKIFLGL